MPCWATAVAFYGCALNNVSLAPQVWVETGTFCLNHTKKHIQTMVQWSKMPSSTTLSSPLALLTYLQYVDLPYPPPHANVTSKHSCKLICSIETMETHDGYATKKVAMTAVTIVTEAAVVAMQGLGDILDCGRLQKDGDRVLWQCQIHMACDN